jgi:thiamine biosynthesis lipoprotein
MNARPNERQTVTHEAMDTRFAVTVVHTDPRYARQAVTEAFAELDRIEGRLSRFAEGSDVFRLNRLGPGQSTMVHPDTFACLHVAREVQEATEGAFDVAYASTTATVGHRFHLDRSSYSVRVLAPGVRLDLGGIGKGFALDRMAALLKQWDVEAVLLCASSSTVLAMNPPPNEAGWPIRLGPDRAPLCRLLSHAALSGSGRAVKGAHVIDGRLQSSDAGWWRTWAAAPSGAVADALSTAFMVMSAEQIQTYCASHDEVSAYALASEDASPLVVADRLPQRGERTH